MPARRVAEDLNGAMTSGRPVCGASDDVSHRHRKHPRGAIVHAHVPPRRSQAEDPPQCRPRGAPRRGESSSEPRAERVAPVRVRKGGDAPVRRQNQRWPRAQRRKVILRIMLVEAVRRALVPNKCRRVADQHEAAGILDHLEALPTSLQAQHRLSDAQLPLPLPRGASLG
eukprot:4887590-Prymnesium_polylepis.1